MYKLSIKNEVNGREYGSTWESQSEKNKYLDKIIAKQGWGLPERSISEEEISDALRARIISTQITPATEDEPEKIVHLVKADYVITETNLNLSKTYRNQKKIEARKKDYPSIEEVLHILLDHGVDSEQYASLQAERAAIKLKHALEK